MRNLLLKADVKGSLDALTDTLELHARVVHRGLGPITPDDVARAAAESATIMGFHVRPTPAARSAADRDVEILLCQTIHDAVCDISGIESDRPTEIGIAEVRSIVFTGDETVATCQVLEGRIERKAWLRVIHEHVQVFEAWPRILRMDGRDVAEVGQGDVFELSSEWNYRFVPGDVLECFSLDR